MSVGFLSQLTLLAAEATASGSLFDQMAARFRAGKGGMYPIAICAVIALAIIIERCVVLFFSAPINKDGFLRGLKKFIYAGDLDKAINYVAGQKNTPL
ncbi:MAG: MotA/TolQ/ExbB proton channel family protein, partial [Myxococcaceae bacterium]